MTQNSVCNLALSFRADNKCLNVKKEDFNMKDECLICGAPLKYLENDEC